MKILYYKEANNYLPGISTEGGVINITQYAAGSEKKQYSERPLTVEDITQIRKYRDLHLKRSGELMSESSLTIGPCVPMPPKIICIGLNYRRHAIETGMEIPVSPVIFTKYNNCLTDYGADITLGNEGEQFDYEVELGVIIGRRGKNISKKEALHYVLGYCVANDLSCRDLQFKTSQWLLGKSLDQFLPLGKYFVTSDELIDPQNLRLYCTMNGEQRQNSNTSDMIFSVAELIEYLSKYMTLEPGDLILTGTPEGVIMGMQQKRWIRPGDRVRVEIEKLGCIENRMI